MSGLSEMQRFGLSGEQWALAQLQALGYQAHLVSDWFADVDLIISSILPCEVKLARPRRHRAHGHHWRIRWQFDTGRMPANVDSLAILICEDDSGERWPYLVPSWLIWPRRTIQITSHPERYRGRLAGCLNAWSNVEMVLAERRKRAGQLTLPLLAGLGGER